MKRYIYAISAAVAALILLAGCKPKAPGVKARAIDWQDGDVAAVKKYVVNPVESREASLAPFDTLKIAYDAPPMVETLHDFLTLDEAGLKAFVKRYGLAMDGDDLKFCQDYFKAENRCPTLTEIRMLDTYWSDHCRHTTFLTHLKDVQIDDPAARKT